MPPFLNGHGEADFKIPPPGFSPPKRHQRNQQPVDYSTPGSTGYNVPQNTTWRDPNNREIRVLTIGAGISGILMAYQLQKHCENVEHVVYEKNEDIGGMLCRLGGGRMGADDES